MSKVWTIKETDTALAQEIAQDMDIPFLLARLLVNRGIKTAPAAKQFIQADTKDLFDPFLLKDMDKAVARIRQAQTTGERVLVYGDYDVDGVTSSALMNKTLCELGINVVHYIPHRMTEGYGLNDSVRAFAEDENIGLLIAVDCGITAAEEVLALKQDGIDTVIVDHHEPDASAIPQAEAVVNPKQPRCCYPFKDLAAVGLVAKLSQALLGRLDPEMLQLAAMGTVADVVSLHGENRIFVKAGLANFNQTTNIGLTALLDTAKILGKEIRPFHIGFILGPRINASGRMDSAHLALDLFLTKDHQKAYQLARTLDRHNADRQKKQAAMIQEAIDIVEKEVNFNKEKIIVLSKEGWHKGVLGIVASRITDKYYRPAIVISLEEGVGTASARSIEGFHLHDALSLCSEYLETYGGHEGAAGLTIKEEHIDSFRRSINKIAEDKMEIKKLVPKIIADAEISLKDINMPLVKMIESMEPFGEGNPEPVFCSRHLMPKGAPRVLSRETLKFWVTDGATTLSVVGFGLGKHKPLVMSGKPLDLVYHLSIDDWNKAPTVQLKLKDIRLSEE